jgi:lipopolysaccharide export system permease protein
MIVWLSSGLSFTQWIRPVLGFALPLTLLILLLTAWLDPWALEKRNEYRDELKSRAEMALITPGLFAEGSGGDRVYFVETMNPLTGVVRNIFLRAHIDGQLGLVTAREGSYTPMKDGSRYLVLEDGRRYEGVPGKLDYRIIEFERYWMRLDAAEVRPGKGSPKQASLSELVEDASPMARGELLWRFGLPVSALILAIMAIPLSFVNVRARRSYGLVVALLVFFIYNNMLSLSQAWVAQDKLNPWLGTVSIHVVMALATVVLFYLRIQPDPFRRKKR